MINVLNKQTNEVVGFPDTTDVNTINRVISDDNNGTITKAKPNWYQDKVQPALEASGMDMFQPKFLVKGVTTGSENVEPDATRAFFTNYAKEASYGAFDNNNSEVQQINQQSDIQNPLAAKAGSLIGQFQAVLQTAGFGSLIGAVGKIPEATKFGEAVLNNARIGALYGLIRHGVEQWNESIKNNDIPDMVKLGEGALKDAGAFAVYGGMGAGIKSVPVATAAIAGTAYGLSKLDGASEQDALLNSVVMGGFHLSHSMTSPESSKAILDAIAKAKSDYIKSMNPIIDNNIADRAAQEHTQNMAADVVEKSNETVASQPAKPVPEEQPGIGEILMKGARQKEQFENEQSKDQARPEVPGTFKDGHSVEILDYLLNSGIPGKVVARMSGADRLELANGDWKTLRDMAVDYQEFPWKADVQKPVLGNKAEVNPPADKVEQDAAKARGGAIDPMKEVTESPTLMKNMMGNLVVEVTGKQDGEKATTRAEVTPAPEETENAKGTGTEIAKGSEQASGVEQGKEGRVRLRNPAENGVEAKSGEEKIAAQEPVTSEGKEKASKLFERVSTSLDKEQAENPLYRELNTKEAAQKAIDLQKSDPDLVARVSAGIEPAPEGYSETALRFAHREAMKESGNNEAAASSLNSASLRGTRLGQEVNLYKLYKDGTQHDPNDFIKRAIQDRLAKVGKTIKGTRGSVKEKAIKTIDKQKVELRNALDNARVDPDEIQKVIDSIIC